MGTRTDFGLLLVGLFWLTTLCADAQNSGFVDAADFGFSPSASGISNVAAMQKALDQAGTIVVSHPGIYKVAGTLYIGSNTTLEFGNGVIIQKVDEKGTFAHVILNKGALTRTYDEHIALRGMNLSVNGVLKRMDDIVGLRGQVSFFYVKDLRIERFRSYDIQGLQFSIQICTFEDVIIDDVILKGEKDGIHFGPGKRFRVSNGVFQTQDDALALNAHDYTTGNPEVGWIEEGLVENCYDLSAPHQKTLGYFCRILGGGWKDWTKGMELQNGDAVVSNGRLYRVDGLGEDGSPDEKLYRTLTAPTHASGMRILDGIKWVMMQERVEYTAGVRNVTFRNIYLEKPRIGFSIHFDQSKWSRSYYPGAEVPVQRQLLFDNIRVLHDESSPVVRANTPVDVLTITNSSFRNSGLRFEAKKGVMSDYLTTRVNITNSTFNAAGEMTLLDNTVDGKVVHLRTTGNIETSEKFSAKIREGNGRISVDSDLTGLNR